MSRNKYDRAAIMRRAHQIRRETRQPFGSCLQLAWSEAKGAGVPSPAITPALILPPLVAAGRDVIRLARKLKGARIEVGLRVKVDVAARVTPKADSPITWGGSREIAGGFDNRAGV
jgi:hypothetical protein